MSPRPFPCGCIGINDSLCNVGCREGHSLQNPPKGFGTVTLSPRPQPRETEEQSYPSRIERAKRGKLNLATGDYEEIP